MRIAVISSSIFPCPPSGYAGLEQIAWETARGLGALGHDVTLFAPIGSWCPNVTVIPCLPPGFPEERMYGGCTYKNANGEDIQWPGYWSKLLEFNDGGVIICHSWECWPANLKLEGRLKCPILKVMHAPVNTQYHTLPPEKVASFICISDDQRSHFEALHSPRQARTCHNGIDLDFYRSLEAPRTNRFLFLARFSTIKGADIALRQCKNAGVGIDLIGDTSITGEPGYYEECRQLAVGMPARIIPGVPRGETVWWYSQAHCFLHPNMRFREPLGLAPLEAQACGLPVVTFNHGAMRETVKHGETGWLATSEDEFGIYVRSAAGGISDASRNRCREWASQFSLQVMVKRYEELCEEALSTGGW